MATTCSNISDGRQDKAFMKAQQLLRDPGIEPTGSVIADALGASYSAYMQFIEALNKHDVHIEWRYYNDGKAWLGKGLFQWTTSRGTQKEMTVFWLSVWDGFFRVSLFIPEKAREDLRLLPLSGAVREMVDNAKQMGKLKFFPLLLDLHSDELFDDVFTIISFKKTIK